MQNHPGTRIPLRIFPLLATLPLYGLAGCAEPPHAAAESPRPAYVVTAQAGTGERLDFVGEIRAVRRAELAFPVSGRVASVKVETGDRVSASQILATLDPQPLSAQLATASGDVARAESHLREVRQRHERIQAVQATGAVSPTELSAVQAELASTQAALRSAAAQRDSAAWSLEQATLRAPVSGVISARHLELGQATGPGTPVISLDGAGRELSVLVPASLALRPGQSVVLHNDVTRLDSQILRIGGRLETGGVKRVFLSVPEAAVIGSTWSVALTGKQHASTLHIPLRAVLPGSKGDSGQVLRIAKDGHTVEQIPVKLGEVQGDAIEIRDGIRGSDRIIVAGAAAIRPGSKVKPVASHSEVQP